MPHQRISSGKSLESVIGYSRAVRAGAHVYVAGTTGVLPEDHPDAPGDAYAQTKHAFEIIETGLIEAGASVGDVVRTRVFLTNIQDADAVGQAHHEMFGATLPASAFIGIASLIGGQAVVEIEVDAVISEAVG